MQSDLLSHFPDNVFEKSVVESRDQKLFFNPRHAALLELHDNGLLETMVDTSNNHYTLCHPGFCSFRNHKENAGRQPSIVFM